MHQNNLSKNYLIVTTQIVTQNVAQIVIGILIKKTFWKLPVVWQAMKFKKMAGMSKTRFSRATLLLNKAKPRVSLTAPNCNHCVQVSLMVLDIFLDAITKAKKLICKSIVHNLKQVSLTKSFFSSGNGV